MFCVISKFKKQGSGSKQWLSLTEVRELASKAQVVLPEGYSQDDFAKMKEFYDVVTGSKLPTHTVAYRTVKNGSNDVITIAVYPDRQKVDQVRQGNTEIVSRRQAILDLFSLQFSMNEVELQSSDFLTIMNSPYEDLDSAFFA